MLLTIKNIYSLLSKRNKLKFKILILLIFLTSIFEIVGLALILPFLFLVNNLNIVHTNKHINIFYNYMHFHTPLEFLYFIGGLAIAFSFLGMVLSIYTNIKLTKFSNDLGADFSVRLLHFYATQHDIEPTPEIYKEKRKKIITDTVVIANNIILPSLMIIAKFLLVAVLFAGLLFISYKVTLLLSLILLLVYILIFHFSHTKIKQNIKNIKLLKEKNNSLVMQTLKGMSNTTVKEKDIHTKKYFSQVYQLSRYQSFNNTVAKLPRYLMMFLVLSSVIITSIYLIREYQGNMSDIMHKMLLFIVLGLKLLPQIQNIFINYLKLKSNLYTFENIKDELFEANGNTGKI